MAETSQEPSGNCPAGSRGSTSAFRWAVAIVAGLDLAVVLVIGMNLWSTTYMVTDDGDVLIDGKTLESDVVAASPSGQASTAKHPLDPATTDPVVFANQSYEAILSTTVPILEDRRVESLQKIDSFFATSAEGTLPKREDITLPTEENMRAQDIERTIAADKWTITEVALTNSGLARNLALALFNNENLYNAFVAEDLDGSIHATRTGVIAVSPELLQGRIRARTIDGPSRVILVIDYDRYFATGQPEEMPMFNRVVTNYTYDGGKAHYSIVDQIQQYDPAFTEYPDNLTPILGG